MMTFLTSIWLHAKKFWRSFVEDDTPNGVRLFLGTSSPTGFYPMAVMITKKGDNTEITALPFMRM